MQVLRSVSERVQTAEKMGGHAIIGLLIGKNHAGEKISSTFNLFG